MSLVIERSRFYAAALHKSVLLVAGTLCYVSISLLWLPYGLNLQSLKILSLLLWPALAVLFVFLKLNKFEHHQLVVKANAYDVSNVILVLLPMTPILRYILANQDILSSHQSVGVFCLFLLASLIYAYFLPILLSLALAHIDEFTILGLSFTFSLFFSPYLSSCNYFYQTLLIPLCVGLTSFIGFGAYLLTPVMF